MATFAYFSDDPETVWAWYIFRRSKCLEARPNPAHRAIVELEDRIADRFALITQNVDGLHREAGSGSARSFEIHGNISKMRCSGRCSQRRPRPLPTLVEEIAAGPKLSSDQIAALHCADCGAWMRPHVLWFDEYYTEEHCRSESATEVAWKADLLLIVGTTGATTLPSIVGEIAMRKQIPIFDVNPDAGVFAKMAERSPGGGHLSLPASEGVPAIVERLIAGWG